MVKAQNKWTMIRCDAFRDICKHQEEGTWAGCEGIGIPKCSIDGIKLCRIDYCPLWVDLEDGCITAQTMEMIESD